MCANTAEQARVFCQSVNVGSGLLMLVCALDRTEGAGGVWVGMELRTPLDLETCGVERIRVRQYIRAGEVVAGTW